MVSIGQMNRVTVQKRLEHGWVVTTENEQGSLFLPSVDAPKDLEIGQSIFVFVYRDNNHELIATTARAKALVGQVALLKAKVSTAYGAFFDWGLSKDLFVSVRDQKDPVVAGEKYLVYLFVDRDEKVAGTTKYHKHLDLERHSYRDGDEVHLTVTDETPLGYNTIVDYKFSALLYRDQIFRSLKTGDQLTGYIRQVREDGLLDVSTQKPGYGKVVDLTDKILNVLEKRGGELEISDKSSPELIQKQFNCSKKAFKQAIGSLKKQGKIDILPSKIVSK